MKAMRNIGFLAVCVFGLAVSASAQIDGARFATDLRAKYGPPLARETFTGRPGISMIVDYASNGHVCRIQLPPVGPSSRQPGVITPQAVDEFLDELLPPAMRGKELGRTAIMMGLPSVSMIEYEYVTIAEMSQGSTRTGITVTFKNETCAASPEP